jgi:GntR family transcriptional regulator / MocR family aminotransferase
MASTSAASLCLRIDARARAGLQTQIYDGVRRAILDGVVTPGARLSSSRALAFDLDVSRATTLLAYEQLLAEGYLTTRRGSGTYVANELPDDLPRARRAGPPRSPRHPPLSRRGGAIAAVPPTAVRGTGPPRAFRIGTPGLDLFPVRLWTQLLNRRLRKVTRGQLDYCHLAGLPALREAIADRVRSVRGTECVAAQVIVVAGAQSGIQLICQALLDPGDEVCLEEPGYPGARSALIAAGAMVRPVRVDEDGLSVERLARHDNVRLVYVTPSHQFPLGVQMSLPRRLALLRWAARARAWVMEDDYDSEFRYGTRPIPCLHGLDSDNRVIYVGSFSKSLFPALRMGFLVVPLDLRESLIAARLATDVHPPWLEQAVLADLMDGGHFDRHVRRMRAAYGERLDALRDAVERVCGGALRLRPVRTGLHAIADLEGVDDELVFHEAELRGVEVMPLSWYFSRPPARANGLVLGFAPVRPDALRAGVEKLAAAIDAARRVAPRARHQALGRSASE